MQMNLASRMWKGLLNPTTNLASRRRKVAKKLALKLGLCTCVKSGSFAYWIRGYIICLPSYRNIFFHINSN